MKGYPKYISFNKIKSSADYDKGYKAAENIYKIIFSMQEIVNQTAISMIKTQRDPTKFSEGGIVLSNVEESNIPLSETRPEIKLDITGKEGIINISTKEKN